MWTAARSEVSRLTDVAAWMAERPAELAGLRRKGQIAVGFDADFCVFAPDDVFVVDPARLHHRHPVTPVRGLDRCRAWYAARCCAASDWLDAGAGPRGQLPGQEEDG